MVGARIASRLFVRSMLLAAASSRATLAVLRTDKGDGSLGEGFATDPDPELPFGSWISTDRAVLAIVVAGGRANRLVATTITWRGR